MVRIEPYYRAYFEHLFNDGHPDQKVYHILQYLTEQDGPDAIRIRARVICKRRDSEVSYRSERAIVPEWMALDSGCTMCLACAEVLHNEGLQQELDLDAR